MSRLAVRFGYSDVGLAKACTRMLVPVPGRGYWAKKEVGRSPKPTRLPTLPKGSGRNKLELHVRRREQPSAIEAALESSDSIDVDVPEVLTDPHPLVATTIRAFRGGKSDYEGFLRPKHPACLSVTVTMAHIDRAMLIYDGIIRAIEDRGHVVEVQKYKRDGYSEPQYRTVAIVDGEILEMDLTEVRTRIDRKLEDRRPLQTKTELVPSGRLALTLNHEFRYEGMRWSDDRKRSLDSQLGKFIHALAIAALAVKEQRLRNEERQREQLEEQQREHEEHERRRAESGRIRALDAEIDRMHAARWAREYIDKLRTALAGNPDQETQEIRDWLMWVEAYAQRIDPFFPYPAVPKDPKPWG